MTATSGNKLWRWPVPQVAAGSAGTSGSAPVAVVVDLMGMLAIALLPVKFERISSQLQLHRGA